MIKHQSSMMNNLIKLDTNRLKAQMTWFGFKFICDIIYAMLCLK